MGVSISVASPLPDDVTLQNFNGSWRIANKVLLETIIFSGDASKDSGSLPSGYDYYLIEGSVQSNGNNNLLMRVNSLNGTFYNYVTITGATLASVVNATSLQLVVMGAVGSVDYSMVRALIQRSAPVRAVSGQNQSMFKTSWNGSFYIDKTSAFDVSTLNFLTSAGTITGTLKIYGVKVGGGF